MATLLFLLFLLSSLQLQVTSTTFILTNNCDYTVWPGLLSGSGSPPLSTTGFSLPPTHSFHVSPPPSWSGRIWARTLCSSDPSSHLFSCATADCSSAAAECLGQAAKPPATLAEFTLGSTSIPNSNDFYDVSLVDGFNLPILVSPAGGSGPNCRPAGCAAEVNAACPAELAVEVGSAVVACRSACEAFGNEEYCCSGSHANPGTCGPTAYSEFFKKLCPAAYSYAYDDATSTFTCAAGTADYVITFCPNNASVKSSRGSPTAGDAPLINATFFFSGSNVEQGQIFRWPAIILALLALSSFRPRILKYII